ncbi:PPC domain-containing protein [Heracleum sosnowskyi]|uniref:PPC domain-containing protein n=1 Tax=Heracleum sosnowskyi TaxID=360622 RepID=A0AAD8ICQ4_9APIA|nr:PPC domain-containing protein [Heracleum sosnowskyi]
MSVPKDLSPRSSEGDEVHPPESIPPTGATGGATIKPVILDVPDGVDIIDWVAGFANSNKICITVVGGFGKVSLAALSRLKSPAPPLLYIEHLTLINLSGTYQFSTLAEGSPTFFNALLGRLNGAVIGGAASRMVAMSKVGLSAYVFQNPKIITIKTEFH